MKANFASLAHVDERRRRKRIDKDYGEPIKAIIA